MQNTRLTLKQIYNLDVDVLYSEYIKTRVDIVKVDGVEYTNYGQFSFIWEKSYVETPARSNDGSMPTMNSAATFVIPHFTINFSIISIDDWRSLMRNHLEKNEHIVDVYDAVYNERIVRKMYFATEEMPKFHMLNRRKFVEGENAFQDFVTVAGVDDYTLEMIGTNNALDFLSITYHYNPPTETGLSDSTIGESDVYSGDEFLVGSAASAWYDETFNGKYRFEKWVEYKTNESGNIAKREYSANDAITVYNDLVLYAVWLPSETHKLTYSYGMADPAIVNGQPLYSKVVTQGKSIGTLPPFESSLQVVYNGTTYENVYTNGAWRKSNNDNGTIVNSNEEYWTDHDTSIYLVYQPSRYTVSYETNMSSIQMGNISVEYGNEVLLPKLYRTGYKFVGWFTDTSYEIQFSGTMPPYPITLYAKWE